MKMNYELNMSTNCGASSETSEHNLAKLPTFSKSGKVLTHLAEVSSGKTGW